MNVNLVLFRKDGTTKSFTLPSTVTVVGRREDCDLCIPLMVVSRKHCELNLDQEQLKLRDLGSRNGTFLNDRQVEEIQVNAGDRIRVGPVTFAVQVDGEPANDSAILRAPKHIAESEEQPSDHAKILANMDDVDTLQDHSVAELLDGLAEEAAGNSL